MTYLTKFMASLLLVLGMVSIVGAATIAPASDDFGLYQSDTEKAAEAGAAAEEGKEAATDEGKEATDGTKKKKKGDEPDCE